jgi:hypothetical protein
MIWSIEPDAYAIGRLQTSRTLPVNLAGTIVEMPSEIRWTPVKSNLGC